MKAFKYLQPDIDEGRLKRQIFAQEAGIPLEDLIRSEEKVPEEGVPEYGQYLGQDTADMRFDDTGERPMAGEIRGEGLNLLRKPMYDAMIDELRRRKMIEGAK